MSNVVNLNKYRQMKRMRDWTEKSIKVDNLLTNWTYVHQTKSKQFTLEQLEEAVDKQVSQYEGPRCNDAACRLWAVSEGDCLLHTITRKDEVLRTS